MSLLSCFNNRKKKGIRILALLCSRNEEIYLKKNLTCLLEAGLKEYIEEDGPEMNLASPKETIDKDELEIIESITVLWRKELGY